MDFRLAMYAVDEEEMAVQPTSASPCGDAVGMGAVDSDQRVPFVDKDGKDVGSGSGAVEGITRAATRDASSAIRELLPEIAALDDQFARGSEIYYATCRPKWFEQSSDQSLGDVWEREGVRSEAVDYRVGFPFTSQ